MEGVTMMTREPSTHTVSQQIVPVEPPAGAGKPHTMTVFAQGANTPTLRLQGRWLGQAGFPVGARVRVNVSPRRLIVDVVEESPRPAGCAGARSPNTPPWR
jgi:hypothetical protein